MYLAPVSFLDRGAAGVVIPMRVADQQNLRVAEFEAEFFDARLNQRNVASISLLIRMFPCGVVIR